MFDIFSLSRRGRPLVWLHGEIKTPPFSASARVEAGLLLRRLQRGESLAMPHSRPMPEVGPRCHELRVLDRDVAWRIMYHLTTDTVVVLDVFQKTTHRTPNAVLAVCRRRLRHYLETAGE